MKARISQSLLVSFLLLVIAMTIACSKGKTDAQLVSDVQGKIQSDANIASKGQVAVQAAEGVVVLTGTVANETERLAAENDARQIPGVKNVIDSLQLAPTPAEMAASQPEPAPMQEPETPARAPRRAHKESPIRSAPETTASNNSQKQPVRDFSDSTNSPNMMANNNPVPTTPPPPPPPRKVTVPDGTTFAVRLNEALSSDRSRVGDVFHGTLSQPVVLGDNVVIPQDSDVEGRVIDVKDAAHFSGASALAVQLTKLTVNGTSYDLHTEEFRKQGTARGKNTAEKVGGGAVLGAVLGGLIGGGKGAAIGAAAGAGTGGGVQAATKGQQVRLSPETELSFRLSQPIEVTPVKNSERPGRRKLNIPDDNS